MQPPDSNDVFDKLRHAVAQTGSGLPIHKEEEPPAQPQPPPSYDAPESVDLAAARNRLSQAITEGERAAAPPPAAEAPPETPSPHPPAEAIEDALARVLASPETLRQKPVYNPVLPRARRRRRPDGNREDRRGDLRSLALLALGVLALLGGGALLAHRSGWHPKGDSPASLKMVGGDETLLQAMREGHVKILEPPPAGGPSEIDLREAAKAAVAAHYAAMPLAADLRPRIASLRLIARQPTKDPWQWQVLMSVSVRVAPEDAKTPPPQLETGPPDQKGAKMIELPQDAGAAGAPPPVPFINAPIGPVIDATGAQIPLSLPNGPNAPVSGGNRILDKPAAPQPRWVSVSWSGERWVIGDYEFD